MDSVLKACESLDHYDILSNRNVLEPIPGTYDTYRCTDCGCTMSGYKRGDPHLKEHIWTGQAQCRYIVVKFKNRLHELAIIQGQLRIQKGFLAFPNSLLHSTYGYVAIQGTYYCVFCSCAANQGHFIACQDMISRLKRNLRSMTLSKSCDETWLLLDHDSQVHGDSDQGPSSLTLLGEKANMQYVEGTSNEHVCFQCNLQLRSFERNDTLLGEHIYYIYNNGLSCPYLEDRFSKNREKLELILGQERFRKGLIAFPNALTTSSNAGNTVVNGLRRCIVCARHVFTEGHHALCENMQNELKMKLREIKLL